MQRKVSFSEGEYYHIYSRGSDKRVIFSNAKEHNRFQKMLFLCNSQKPVLFGNVNQDKFYDYERAKTLVDIGAYCLMPNHFHILIREKREGGISAFMKKLLTGYSMYFNIIHKRTGVLFEGRFKATHVTNDRYLKYLFSYIHLNPVKILEPKWKEVGLKNNKKAASFVSKYPYSSYADYLGDEKRRESIIVSKESFPKYFSKPAELQREMFEWLKYEIEI